MPINLPYVEELDEDFDGDGDLRDPFFMKLVNEMNFHYNQEFCSHTGQEYDIE